MACWQAICKIVSVRRDVHFGKDITDYSTIVLGNEGDLGPRKFMIHVLDDPVSQAERAKILPVAHSIS